MTEVKNIRIQVGPNELSIDNDVIVIKYDSKPVIEITYGCTHPVCGRCVKVEVLDAFGAVVKDEYDGKITITPTSLGRAIIKYAKEVAHCGPDGYVDRYRCTVKLEYGLTWVDIIEAKCDLEPIDP